jgi:fructose-1,6-bisphosphatase II
VKCLGGQLLGRLWPRDEAERTAAQQAGYDLERVLTSDDLVAEKNTSSPATGITDGDMLEGVRYPSAGGATTESLVTRSRSGTIRRIRATHDRAKLRAVAGDSYD